MNERMCESISALMDDEANELELERVLAQISGNDPLRRTWTDYNLAQHAVHGEQLAHRELDISTRVRAAIGSAESVGATTGLRQRLLRPVASVAVAASVALTVVIGGQQLAQVGSSDPAALGASVAANASPVGMLNSLGATTVQASYGMQPLPVLQPATRNAYRDLAQQRERKFMQQHAEQAALNSPQGLVPFARVPQIHQ
jgi:sigma-E factor negative regulatory protein RseA